MCALYASQRSSTQLSPVAALSQASGHLLVVCIVYGIACCLCRVFAEMVDGLVLGLLLAAQRAYPAGGKRPEVFVDVLPVHSDTFKVVPAPLAYSGSDSEPEGNMSKKLKVRCLLSRGRGVFAHDFWMLVCWALSVHVLPRPRVAEPVASCCVLLACCNLNMDIVCSVCAGALSY